MRKYNLTYTQMAVMYYVLMLKNWVKYVEHDFYVILSSKIEEDLKLHPKTVEANLTQLKKLGLIETKRCKVDAWNKHRTYRGIRITTLGKEYNLSFYKEKEYQYALELEKENEAFRVENDAIQSKNRELQSQQSGLETQKEILNLTIEADKKLNQRSIETLEENKRLQEKCLTLEIENRELKANNKQNISLKEEELLREKDLEKFREKIISQYSKTGKPICNAVPNEDNWLMDIKFYINGYSRLSIYLANGKMKQLTEPKQIANFWRWLFEHQHRVGVLLDTSKLADISPLLIFIGALIILNKESYTIKSLTPVAGGVKISVTNKNNEIISIKNGFGREVIDVDKCRKFFELNTCEGGGF
jgi:DNA-binding MarR family transcriptional regulator